MPSLRHCTAVNETTMKDMVELMVSDGFVKAGYTYLNLDGAPVRPTCWTMLRCRIVIDRDATFGTVVSGSHDLRDLLSRLRAVLFIYKDSSRRTFLPMTCCRLTVRRWVGGQPEGARRQAADHVASISVAPVLGHRTPVTCRWVGGQSEGARRQAGGEPTALSLGHPRSGRLRPLQRCSNHLWVDTLSTCEHCRFDHERRLSNVRLARWYVCVACMCLHNAATWHMAQEPESAPLLLLTVNLPQPF